NLASVIDLKGLDLQTADYIRQVPLPRLKFPLDFKDTHKAWTSSIHLSLTELLGQSISDQK
ncbi:MAG: hypothetical protein KDD40_12500, partial [Bdellovibrionales bacterium]|nr:hypothetical protein [Bdellovibrionales bacterium]